MSEKKETLKRKKKGLKKENKKLAQASDKPKEEKKNICEYC